MAARRFRFRFTGDLTRYKLKPKPGYPELINTLLAKGADINAVDVDGNTPLIAAAEKD